MGRLDEHAKRRIVELRRAGLSFRKIKKVLELDDIQVTPQAVYLFLKRKRVGLRPAAPGWAGDQPWPPLQGHEAEPPRLLGTRPPAVPLGDPTGSQDTREGIQIVSVASLCEDNGELGDPTGSQNPKEGIQIVSVASLSKDSGELGDPTGSQDPKEGIQIVSVASLSKDSGEFGDPTGSQDTKEGIQIVTVDSLCKDNGELGDPMGSQDTGEGIQIFTGDSKDSGELRDPTGSQDTKEGIQIVTVDSVCKDNGELRGPMGSQDTKEGIQIVTGDSLCEDNREPGDPTGSQDTKEGIQIVTVDSLCKDNGELGGTLPTELAPGHGDDSSTGTTLAPGSCPIPGGLATPPQPLPGQGQLVTPHSRNPALGVQTTTVDRAVLLQKKVKDASTQTALPNLVGPENHHLAWGVPVPPCAASSQAIAEKLDAVQAEVQKLSQALHVVLERQCRLERQQEHQQRLQQEVLVTLQQLSSTVSHGAVPANQPYVPFSSMAEPSPTVPNFSQFKMELI